MGRIYKPTRKAIGPDGAPVLIEYEHFYIEYTDSSGHTRRRKAALKAADAKDALRQAESEVLAEKNGLPTRKAGELLLKELLADYAKALQQRATPLHVAKTKTAIEKACRGTRAVVLKDLKPEKMEGYLADLGDKGISARSINEPLVAVKSMLNWAVQTRRIPYNPLACVKAATGEKKRVRRALSENEIASLLAAALDGPTRRALRVRQNRPRKDKTFKPVKMPSLQIQAKLASEGRNAAVLYRLMLEAGLRLNEARCLTWADLSLETKAMQLRGETTKNGKTETLPIAPALLAALEARKEELKPAEGAPVVRITSRVLKTFNDDLTAAGIDKRDAAGRTIDLHALRHTFGTRLMRNGTDMKTIQSLMRHATAALTLGIYVHSDKTRMAAAVETLPVICAAAKVQTATLKTGTDDAPAAIVEVNPLHSRYAKSENCSNANTESALQNSAIPALNHRVGGSSPPGRIKATPRNSTQTIETPVTSNSSEAAGVSVSNCNEAQTNAQQGNVSRHISATQNPSQFTPLPSDLAALVERWPTLPANIRSAILALAGMK